MTSPHDLGPAFVAGPRSLLTEHDACVLTLQSPPDVARGGSIAWTAPAKLLL
jgi:hypothetical protein